MWESLRRPVRLTSIALALALAVAAATVGGTRAWLQRRERQRDRHELAGGIDLHERWSLGGLPQWVRIRGRDASKPLLVWLHGGPGFPQLPFAAAARELEKDFVVIHWDQRGAGRTYRENPRPPGMELEQFVRDTRDLLLTAQHRFGRQKCVLVGHSWGSIVGAVVASRFPELVSVYVGVGQMSSYRAGEQDRYGQSLAAAQQQGNAVALRELHGVGPPPHRDMVECAVIDRWFEQLVPPRQAGVSPWTFVRLAFASPDCTWLDLAALPRGVRSSRAALQSEIYHRDDVAALVRRLEMPVHLFVGEHDRIAPLALAEKFLAGLEAPRGASLHRFRQSTHWTFLEEPERFCTLLREVAGGER